MRTGAIQEATMPTQNQKMSGEQIDAFIRKRREEDDKSFQEIATELAKMGITSPKTRKPLPMMTVRYRYYNQSKVGKANAAGQAEKQLDMIRKMLALPKADEKVKLQLIQSVLEED